MKFSELKKVMREFNEKHNIERKVDEKFNENGILIEMVGKVVYKQEALKHQRDLEHRTFKFNNYNKALTSNDLGYSIFAYRGDYTKFDDYEIWRIEYDDDELFENCEIVYIAE